MTRTTDCLATRRRRFGRLALPRWPWRRRPAPPVIEERSLPEHLRRDLGFADGRPSRRRDPMRD